MCVVRKRPRCASARMATFAELGVCAELAAACEALGWKAPTSIQAQAIPQALQGKDIIGLAQTGAGKTGAFALPILQARHGPKASAPAGCLRRLTWPAPSQALLDKPQPFFALVLSPTRELALQIAGQARRERSRLCRPA